LSVPVREKKAMCFTPRSAIHMATCRPRPPKQPTNKYVPSLRSTSGTGDGWTFKLISAWA